MSRPRKPKPSRSPAETNAEIIAGLDVVAEFKALGLQFSDVEPRASGKAACFAFFREEAKPSAWIDVNSGHYGDSGGGDGKAISLWEFAHRAGRFPTWQAARVHYAAIAGVKLGAAATKATARNPLDALDYIDWTKGNEETTKTWGLCWKPTISVEAIKLAGGRPGYGTFTDKHGERHRRDYLFAVPAFGPLLTSAPPVAQVAWKLDGHDFSIFKKGAEPTTAKMKSFGPTHGALMNAHALAQMVAANSLPADGRPVLTIWKVEGPTDMLALQTAIPAELRNTHVVTALASTSKGDFPDQLASNFAGHVVYVLHDADTTGEAGAAKSAAVLARYAAECRHVRLPYDVEAKHGSDVRDWLRDGQHSYQDLLALAAAGSIVEPEAKEAETPTVDVTDRPTTTLPVEHDDDPYRLATVFLAANKQRLYFWRQEWWQHNGRAVRQFPRHEMYARLSAAAKREFDRISIEAMDSPADTNKDVRALKVTRHLINNVAGALEGLCLVPDSMPVNSWLGGDSPGPRNWVGMDNGILDLEGLLSGGGNTIQPHSDDWLSTICLPYAFDPAATCPRWLETLSHNLERDGDRIKLLQEWAGYCLTVSTAYQKFMVLEGEGANGKSVYCAGLEALIGRENVSHVPLENFCERFDLTQTLGKLANIAADCGEIEKAAEGKLKSFTSGDVMFFDRKGISGISCAPTARLVLATNNRPRFSDRSTGVWRRMLLVPFRVQIEEGNRVLGMDKPEWWEASGELSGIFNWAIIGLYRLRAQGRFTESKICKDEIAKYQLETNPARAFLLGEYESSDTCEQPTDTLYEHYKTWCRNNGYSHPLSKGVFGREIIRAFPKAERFQKRDGLKHVWGYRGIGERKTPDSNTLD